MFGCGTKEEIRSYPIPKEVVELPDRMMGAILPTGDQTWYFKVVGPAAAMNKNADKITEFFQSIRVNEGAAKPEWEVPEGWGEQPGSGMRAATLFVPAEGKALDLSVIALPTTGAPGELLSNVNRWRGQLDLPPVDERGLSESTKEMKVGDATMTIVDVRGRFSAGRMTPPFAGGGPFSGPPRQPGNASPGTPAEQSDVPSTVPSAELPPGHPPVGSGVPTDVANAAPLAYKAPESWKEQPATGMRKAAFLVQDGDRSAEVTVIDLARSAPNVADPLRNVNRWRGEIGLEPIEQGQLDGVMQEIEVGGQPSQYVELIPDRANPAESKADKATVAAIVSTGDVVWFFKMKGDRDVVVAQRDNFKTFLESVRFQSADGAGDGN